MGTDRAATSSSNDDESLANAAEPVLEYVKQLPWVHSEAVATNLALTHTFLTVKDALTDYLSPQGPDLTRAEYHFLVLLYLAKDKRRPLSEMARELSFSPGYITKLVDQLEDAGLVERQAGVADRRVTFAHLTERGDEKCASIAPAFVGFMEEVSTALTSKEMSQLRGLLAKYEARAVELRNRIAL